MLRIPRGEPVLFASDMHLSPDAPGTETLFLDRLGRHGPGAAHLILLGDLFELWVGDDGADAVANRLADALTRLSEGGTHVWLMRGNRDFLLDVPVPADPGSTFSARCGATLLEDPCPLELHGVPALLAHGDALCTDDRVYQQWRTTCRDPAWQRAFIARPLVTGAIFPGLPVIAIARLFTRFIVLGWVAGRRCGLIGGQSLGLTGFVFEIDVIAR